MTDHCLSQTHAVFYTASKGTLSILSFQRGTYTPLTLPPFKDVCLTSSNVVILTSSSRLEVRPLASPSSPSRQVKVHPSHSRVLPLGGSDEKAMCLDAHGTGRSYDLVTGRKGDCYARVVDVTPDGDVVTADEKGVRIGDKSWGCDAGRLEETGPGGKPRFHRGEGKAYVFVGGGKVNVLGSDGTVDCLLVPGATVAAGGWCYVGGEGVRQLREYRAGKRQAKDLGRDVEGSDPKRLKKAAAKGAEPFKPIKERVEELARDMERKAEEDARKDSESLRSRAGGSSGGPQDLSALVCEALTSRDKKLLETCLGDTSAAARTVASLTVPQCAALVAHINGTVLRRPMRLQSLVPWAKEVAKRYGTRVQGLRELRDRVEERCKGLEELALLKGRLELLE